LFSLQLIVFRLLQLTVLLTTVRRNPLLVFLLGVVRNSISAACYIVLLVAFQVKGRIHCIVAIVLLFLAAFTHVPRPWYQLFLWGVVGCHLFGQTFPLLYGSLHRSMFTLLQVRLLAAVVTGG
jgi:hypothetical protein